MSSTHPIFLDTIDSISDKKIINRKKSIQYQEITFSIEEKNIEKWSNALLNQGALAVTIEDAYANTKNENLIFGEPGSPLSEIKN